MAVYLAAPTILGPVSACNTTVWLDNLIVLNGQTQFDVLVGNNVVASGVVITHSRMEVNVGSLDPGAVIRAQQYGAGFSAALTPTDLAVVVAPAPAPADVGYLVPRTHLYDCAYCAVFDGVYPGATVTVYDDHDNVVGSAPGIGGTAIVEFVEHGSKGPKPFLIPTALRGGPPKAMQVACSTVAGSLLVLPELEAPPIDRGGVLRAPSVGTLRGGQTGLEVSNLVPGAQLEVQITHGSTTTAHVLCASGNVGVVHGLAGLQVDDMVQVRQTMAPCRTQGDWATAFVRDLPPPTPKLPSVACAGSASLHIEGLVPDSFVEVSFAADSVLGWATSSTYDMPLPEALAGGTSATARAQFAEGAVWSETSVDVLLTPDEPAGQPTIVNPLHSCGTAVRVIGVQPGRLVGIEANDPKAPGTWWAIGMGWSTDTKIDVPVNATFMSGSLMFRPFELGCIKTIGPTVEMPIASIATTLGAPHIVDPVLDCGSIHISDIVPGAQVDLYRVRWGGVPLPINWKQAQAPLFTRAWMGTYSSTSSTLSVARPRELEIGDTIVAQQRICGTTSSMSVGASVVSGKIERADVAVMCNADGVALPLTSDDVNVGTDLGVSVEHNGKSYLFFGDALYGTAKPIFRIEAPPEPCPRIVSWECSELPVTAQSPSTGVRFQTLAVEGLSLEGYFQVPSGAFSYDGRMYVFVTKTIPGSHVNPPDPRDPNYTDVMASSYLVSATDACQMFRQEFASKPVDTWLSGDPTPDKWLRFINVCPVVISNADWPGLPSATGDGLLLFGTGNYRASDVHLAWAPLTPGEPIPDPSQWWFLTMKDSVPTFTPGEMRKSVGLLGVSSWGELSAAWIPGLDKWLLLGFPDPLPPNGQPALSGFVARAPWGPYEQVYLWQDMVDGNLGMQHADQGPYGNYVINSFTRWDAEVDVATIYVVVSFFPGDFYGTYVMRLSLTCMPI